MRASARTFSSVNVLRKRVRTVVESGVVRALEHAVAEAGTTSGLPVVFAGRVRSGALRISRLHGNRSEALRGLTLPPDVGLGGKALTIGRPVSVRDYARARAITHEHDAAVAREGLHAMVAVPVRVRGEVSAVLYGGVRTTAAIGDRAVTALVSSAARLGLALASVGPGTGIAPPAASSSSGTGSPDRAGWCDAVQQMLTDLAAGPAHPLHDEARQVCASLLAVLRGEAHAPRPPLLSARERNVLELAALGCTDLDIAEHLGLDVVAVRTAVRSLRRVFGVHSRHGAVSAARAAGVLP